MLMEFFLFNGPDVLSSPQLLQFIIGEILRKAGFFSEKKTIEKTIKASQHLYKLMSRQGELL